MGVRRAGNAQGFRLVNGPCETHWHQGREHSKFFAGCITLTCRAGQGQHPLVFELEDLFRHETPVENRQPQVIEALKFLQLLDP